MTPIYQTSTYGSRRPVCAKGFEYARSQNPTRQELRSVIETAGMAFFSVVGGGNRVIKLLQPGGEVIAANDMYGGTWILHQGFRKFGIRFTGWIRPIPPVGKALSQQPNRSG